MPIGFPLVEQEDFRRALHKYFADVGPAANGEHDVAASVALTPNDRWNNLIGAVGTYISGAEPDRVSARDFDAYEDSGVNWRVREGYGATVAAHGEGLRAVLDCPVRQIDHSGKRLKIKTVKGVISADQAIVTLPSTVIAEKEFLFSPALPEKAESARGLPLGLADKLFLSLENAEEFESGQQLFGNIDSMATGAYYFRPFGQPMMECYFGGRLAEQLEAGGEGAFFDFAAAQLGNLLGSDFPRRLKPVLSHRWGADPFARGSYSYAQPGMAHCRALLAAPVNDRLFFAGEACSPDNFSTAHGAYLSGVTAADQVIAARKR